VVHQGRGHIPGTSNADNRYLRSQSSYDAINVVAEVTVTMRGRVDAPGIAFFGLGSGVAAPGFSFEPRTPPAAYARVMPDGLAGSFSITTTAQERIGELAAAAGNGTHRIRLTWNHSARTLIVAIQKNYRSGAFSPTAIIATHVQESFGGTDTRVFLGGSGDNVFDDLRVLALAGTPGAQDCHGRSVSDLAQQLGGIGRAASKLGFANTAALQDAIRDFCASADATFSAVASVPGPADPWLAGMPDGSTASRET
jgi:hypothetical protein